jgi:hypothetical protein
MSLAHTGEKHSEERCKKNSAGHKGRVFSESHKENISKGHIGHVVLPETREKIGSSRRGIPRPKEVIDKIRGEKNANWKGGISFEPYCPKFTNEFKERVRTFFGHRCVECGIPQNGEKLSIHHVNFNKQSCCDNTIPLFVPLCRSCHMKTNRNRPYWEQHFTSMITEKYDGKCYVTKEV